MSLYADYIKEREGAEIIEDHNGFCSFYIKDKECYIADLFIVPSRRDEKYGRNFVATVHDIAKERGCKYLTGKIEAFDKGKENTLVRAIKNGFKIHRIDADRIWIMKEITNG